MGLKSKNIKVLKTLHICVEVQPLFSLNYVQNCVLYPMKSILPQFDQSNSAVLLLLSW
jgi:hypothetical protein